MSTLKTCAVAFGLVTATALAAVPVAQAAQTTVKGKHYSMNGARAESTYRGTYRGAYRGGYRVRAARVARMGWPRYGYYGRGSYAYYGARPYAYNRLGAYAYYGAGPYAYYGAGPYASYGMALSPYDSFAYSPQPSYTPFDPLSVLYPNDCSVLSGSQNCANNP